MKILILSAQPPSPFSGGEIRLLNLIKHLSNAHDFTVLALVHNKSDQLMDYAGRYCRFIPVLVSDTTPQKSHLYWVLNSWKNSLFSRLPYHVRDFYSPLFQKEVKNLLRSETFNLLQVQQLYMVQYLPSSIACPTILDVDNLWSKLLLRRAKKDHRDRLTIQLQRWIDDRKIPAYEKREINKFNACLAVSEADLRFIKSSAPHAFTEIVSNGVDTAHFYPEWQVPARECLAQYLLFIGTMGYEPNVDAVKYFVYEIFPRICARKPETYFKIVGRNPPAEVIALAKEPFITVTGFVEDIRPYLANSSVFVVPVRTGAGTRIKILEAMAMGKAVVSTSIGAEGLDVRDGENIILADDPSEFAEKVNLLLENRELRDKLGRNGLRLVDSHYDWSAIASRLGNLYQLLQRQGNLR